jgi:hypothetical protein
MVTTPSATSKPAPDCRDGAEAEQVTPPYDRRASRVWATRMPTLRAKRNAVRASNIWLPSNSPSKIAAHCTVKMIRE